MSLEYFNIQYQVILDILDKLHISSECTLDKVTCNDLASERSLDLDVRISKLKDITKTKFMNAEYMNIIQSMFSIIFIQNSQKNIQIMKLNHTIVNWFTRISLLKNSKNNSIISADFKSISDLFILKTLNSDNTNVIYPNKNLLVEYFIGTYVINRLRETLPNFVFTLSIFKCDVIPNGNDNIQNFCVDQYSNRPASNYLVLERIPGDTMDVFINNAFNEYSFYSYFIQTLFALDYAQSKCEFIHNDLHVKNIILRDIDTSTNISYLMDDQLYTIGTSKIPTIIDFGLSRVLYMHDYDTRNRRDPQLIPIDGLCRYPSHFIPGADMFKLLMTIIYQLVATKNRTVYDKISWLLEFYGDELPYNLNKNRNNFMHALHTLHAPADHDFYILNPLHPLAYRTPKEFLKWIQNNKYKPDVCPRVIHHVSKIDKLITCPDLSAKEICHNYIGNKYKARLQSVDTNIEILYKDFFSCNELHSRHKSYLVNKYLIEQFNTLFNELKSYSSSNTLQGDIKTRLTIMKDTNEQFKPGYSDYDLVIVNEFNKHVPKIFRMVNLRKFNYMLPLEEFKIRINNIKSELSDYINFYNVYSTYKSYIGYIERITDSNELSVGILKKFKEQKPMFDYYRKTVKSIYKYESNYIFTQLNMLLRILKEFDHISENGKTITFNGNVAYKYYKVIYEAPDLLLYISERYPIVMHSLPTMSDIKPKINDIMSGIKTKLIYYPTISNSQFDSLLSLAQHPDNKYIYNKLSTLVGKISKLPKQLITDILKPGINDRNIYDKLRTEYFRVNVGASKYNPLHKSLKRARYELNFLYDTLRKHELLNAKFTLLDFGGSDGSMLYAIKIHLKSRYMLSIDKSQLISADLDSWSNHDIAQLYPQEITYMVLTENHPIPIESGSMSLVTCFQVLHHIEHIDYVMQELTRVLKPGGFLMIREHDVNDNVSKMLTDIEHSLYEEVINKNTSAEFLDKYTAWYRGKSEWDDLLGKHKLQRVSNVNYHLLSKEYNPTDYYYALYMKEHSRIKI